MTRLRIALALALPLVLLGADADDRPFCEDWKKGDAIAKTVMLAHIQERAPSKVNDCLAEPEHANRLTKTISRSCKSAGRKLHGEMHVGVVAGLELAEQVRKCEEAQ